MEQFPAETDIVVIGSGATGLAAALTAAEAGARVAVFEKQRSFGGTSNFFEGTFAVESDMQRERYITYTREQAFKNIMEYSYWKANPRLVRAIVNESASTIAWLQKEGVEFSDATINMPDTPRTYHVIKGKGEAVIKALVTRAKQLGVVLLASAPVKRIIKTGDRVSGVIIDRDGNETPVKAKAIIIASGGFANNKEWIKKYAGFDLGVNLAVVGNTDKTGDGIRMAFEMGAAEEGIRTIELYRVGPMGPEFAMASQLEYAATQPDLWVNPRGERFCDESIGFYDSLVGNAASRIKEGYSFSLFDDSIKQTILEKGVDKNVTINHPPGSRPLELEKELKAATGRGSKDVVEADTIKELARKTGCDPVVLTDTVDEYNRYCEQGYDDLFGKDRRYLRPLKGPKYYAIKALTIFLGTMGGIKINAQAEVVDKKEKPIPGLYAGGFDAGGMYGESYPIRAASGLASAFALNSGRIAGVNAVRYLKTK
jgi:fumarate reductase flavoprotein subunit